MEKGGIEYKRFILELESKIDYDDVPGSIYGRDEDGKVNYNIEQVEVMMSGNENDIEQYYDKHPDMDLMNKIQKYCSINPGIPYPFFDELIDLSSQRIQLPDGCKLLTNSNNNSTGKNKVNHVFRYTSNFDPRLERCLNFGMVRFEPFYSARGFDYDSYMFKLHEYFSVITIHPRCFAPDLNLSHTSLDVLREDCISNSVHGNLLQLSNIDECLMTSVTPNDLWELFTKSFYYDLDKRLAEYYWSIDKSFRDNEVLVFTFAQFTRIFNYLRPFKFTQSRIKKHFKRFHHKSFKGNIYCSFFDCSNNNTKGTSGDHDISCQFGITMIMDLHHKIIIVKAKGHHSRSCNNETKIKGYPIVKFLVEETFFRMSHSPDKEHIGFFIRKSKEHNTVWDKMGLQNVLKRFEFADVID